MAEHRLAEMSRAVELAVDRDDFAFTSEAERIAFGQLEAEFELLVSREGRSWCAD